MHPSAVEVPGTRRLEDQLPAPLITKENVDDKAFWGNQIAK